MKRSSQWQFLNSIWAISTILGVFNWIIFLYTGIRSKNKTHFYISIFYMIIGFLFWLLIALNLPTLGVIMFIINFFFYFFGMVYSFLHLSSYWERLDLLEEISDFYLEDSKINSMSNSSLTNFIKDNKNNNDSENTTNKTTYSSTNSNTYSNANTDENINNTINDVLNSSNEILSTQMERLNSEMDRLFNSFDTANNSSNESRTETRTTRTTNSFNTDNSNSKNKTNKKVSVNSATMNELLVLEEITPELAEKIISNRKRINGFKNFEEFEEILELKPHISESLEKKVIFDNTKTSNDHNSSNKERIIDL